MAEYVSKENLQAKLNRKKAGTATKRYTEGWNDAILMVKSMIHSEKAADVAPVRHGRWEWCKDYDGDSILVCSECGRVCHEEDAPYCYCGAKMDGGFDNG